MGDVVEPTGVTAAPVVATAAGEAAATADAIRQRPRLPQRSQQQP